MTRTQCPDCDQLYQAKPEFFGRGTSCKQCRTARELTAVLEKEKHDEVPARLRAREIFPFTVVDRQSVI